MLRLIRFDCGLALLLLAVFIPMISGCFYNPKTMQQVSILDPFPTNACPRGKLHSYIAKYKCEGLTDSPITPASANDIVPYTGVCALRFAIRSGNIPAIDELLRNGAKPSACAGYPNSLRASAITVFCKSNPYPVEEVLTHIEAIGLIEDGPSAEILHLSAQNICIPALRQALRLGANPNSRDAEGRTALHLVLQEATDRVVDAINLLRASGADLNAIDTTTGKTPLETATDRFSKAGYWPRLRSALISSSTSTRP